MSAPPPPKPGGGLSLYADLLDPAGDSSASISRGPQLSQQALNAVKEQEAAAAAAKKTDAALRFQPIQNIRRPQPKIQKPKATFPKAVAPTTATAGGASGPGSHAAAGGGTSTTAAPVKSTLADWANTEDDEWMYAGEKRPRMNKKKKKRHDAPAETDWNEIYDPSRPTNVDEYMRSDERIREVREWKALLYRHRRPTEKKRQSSWDSEEDEDQPMSNQFAPPAAYSFAPPPPSPPRTAPPAPPAAPLPDDKTGDDAYARRLALSQGIPPPPPPPEPAHAVPTNAPAAPPPPPPSEPDASTISRAPVRYVQPEPAEVPDAMEEDTEVQDEDEEDAARSNRPGKKGFAARLMSKYGWSKGQGLGAEGTGILAPLQVKVEKRKKKSDAEGGGWREPGGRGKIVQPKGNSNASASASASSDQGGKFGSMSNVIVLRHMLDNIEDLQGEMEGGLGQEIGEECGDKYGRVERLYIDTAAGGSRNVYIKFVETVSALRAVNALDGRVFAGSNIEPRFYDVEDFEKGVYE